MVMIIREKWQYYPGMTPWERLNSSVLLERFYCGNSPVSQRLGSNCQRTFVHNGAWFYSRVTFFACKPLPVSATQNRTRCPTFGSDFVPTTQLRWKNMLVLRDDASPRMKPYCWPLPCPVTTPVSVTWVTCLGFAEGLGFESLPRRDVEGEGFLSLHLRNCRVQFKNLKTEKFLDC